MIRVYSDGAAGRPRRKRRDRKVGKLLKRLLAVTLALLLALGGLSFATAEEDWRDLLRRMY